MSPYSKNVFKQLLKRKGGKCPDELKMFALTLNFYSPRAYNYVRKTFNRVLPHPRTLQKWYESVNCEPGFQKACFAVLAEKVVELKKQGKLCICSLQIDEMSIRSMIEWDGEKFVGYVLIYAIIINMHYIHIIFHLFSHHNFYFKCTI